MEITKRRSALVVGATLAVVGSAGVGTALAANSIASGQPCSPKGAVYTTSTESLLCAPTDSDAKYKWRPITLTGPKGDTGPQGPQGPIGPAGPGGGTQTAKYIDTPITPQHYYIRLNYWTNTIFDDGQAYYDAITVTDQAVPSVQYTVPDGYRVLSAAIVDKFQTATFAGLGSAREQVTPLSPNGATTFTWDGTPIDAKTFTGDYGFIQSIECLDIQDYNDVYGCPLPEKDYVGRHTYLLRLLVDTNTPDLPTPAVTEIPGATVTPATTTLTPTPPTTSTTTPPPTTTTPPPPPPAITDPPPTPPTTTTPPPVP